MAAIYRISAWRVYDETGNYPAQWSRPEYWSPFNKYPYTWQIFLTKQIAPAGPTPPVGWTITSWYLSWRTMSGAGTRVTQPTLTINWTNYTYGTPQEYVTKLQRIKSNWGTWPLDTMISQLQSANWWGVATPPVTGSTTANYTAPNGKKYIIHSQNWAYWFDWWHGRKDFTTLVTLTNNIIQDNPVSLVNDYLWEYYIQNPGDVITLPGDITDTDTDTLIETVTAPNNKTYKIYQNSVTSKFWFLSQSPENLWQKKEFTTLVLAKADITANNTDVWAVTTDDIFIESVTAINNKIYKIYKNWTSNKFWFASQNPTSLWIKRLFDTLELAKAAITTGNSPEMETVIPGEISAETPTGANTEVTQTQTDLETEMNDINTFLETTLNANLADWQTRLAAVPNMAPQITDRLNMLSTSFTNAADNLKAAWLLEKKAQAIYSNENIRNMREQLVSKWFDVSKAGPAVFFKAMKDRATMSAEIMKLQADQEKTLANLETTKAQLVDGIKAAGMEADKWTFDAVNNITKQIQTLKDTYDIAVATNIQNYVMKPMLDVFSGQRQAELANVTAKYQAQYLNANPSEKMVAAAKIYGSEWAYVDSRIMQYVNQPFGAFLAAIAPIIRENKQKYEISINTSKIIA